MKIKTIINTIIIMIMMLLFCLMANLSMERKAIIKAHKSEITELEAEIVRFKTHVIWLQAVDKKCIEIVRVMEQILEPLQPEERG